MKKKWSIPGIEMLEISATAGVHYMTWIPDDGTFDCTPATPAHNCHGCGLSKLGWIHPDYL